MKTEIVEASGSGNLQLISEKPNCGNTVFCTERIPKLLITFHKLLLRYLNYKEKVYNH